MPNDIKNALFDVRKAYRLLADYQQRVLELLSFVREKLGANNYYYCYRNGLPRNFERLERSEASGERFLPFNDLSVLWIRDHGQNDSIHFHQSGDLLIDVWVRSDSGNGNSAEQEMPPDLSESQLRIYFFLCVTPKEESYNWYQQVWSKTPYPPFGEVKTCEGNPGYLTYGEALNLADLADEASVCDAIIKLRQRASLKLGFQI